MAYDSFGIAAGLYAATPKNTYAPKPVYAPPPVQSYYPPNNGFKGTPKSITIPKGTMLQRTGSLYGQFVAPAGTPGPMLSLPYDKINAPTTLLEVLAPIPAQAGKAAPWFDQPGGGMQYYLEMSILNLIEQGFIRIVG